MVTIVNNIVLHMKAAKRIDFKSYHKKKIVSVWMVMNVTRIIAVIISQYIQKLNHYVVPGTDMMLCVNYTSVKIF